MFPNFLKFAAFILIGVYYLFNRNKIRATRLQNLKEKYKGKEICLKAPFKTVAKNNIYMMLVIPSVVSLTAYGLQSLALQLGIPTSIYSMLKGTSVLFQPLTSFVMLKRRIGAMQFWSLFVVFTGILIIMVANLLIQKAQNQNFKGQTSNILIACFLVIVGEAIYTVQFCIEEFVMKNQFRTPFEIIPIEGVFGFILVNGIANPVVNFIYHTNQFDVFAFIKATPTILIPIAVFVATIFFVVICGQHVTKRLSSNHRAILSNLNPLGVWVLGLIERQILGTPYGETLNGWLSLLQLGGYCVVFVGILLFYGVIKIKKSVKSGRIVV